MLKRNKKLTPEQELVQRTERDAVTAFDLALSTEKPGQKDIPRVERTKIVHYALKNVGIAPPRFVDEKKSENVEVSSANIELSFSPNQAFPVSVGIDRTLRDSEPEQYHIAFGPEKSAIVTQIGEKGQPLLPIPNPQEKLEFADTALNEVIVRRKKA